MCKLKFSKTRLPAAMGLSALIGLGALLLPVQDAGAAANCTGGALAARLAVIPSVAHVFDTISISAIGVNLGPGVCNVSNLQSFIVYPSGAASRLQYLAIPGITPSPTVADCPIAGCIPVPLTYVIQPGDVNRDLSWSTPPGAATHSFTVGPLPGFIQIDAGATGFTVPTGAGQTSQPEGGDAPQAVQIVTPRITVTKECVNNCTPYGQPILFRGTVCNAGDIRLTGISASDNPPATVNFAGTTSLGNPFPDATRGGFTLDPGECVNYTGSYTPSGNLCGPLSDTITVTAHDVSDDPQFTPKEVSSTATAICCVSTAPGLTLTKDCQPRQVQVGQSYTETFVVCNTGNVALVNVVIHDSKVGNINIGSLAAGACVTNNQGPFTTTSADCPRVTDTAFATGDNACPASVAPCNCPNQQNVRSLDVTCTVNVVCFSCIRITEEVVCVKPDTLCDAFTPNPNDQTNACGMRNESGTDCSAFCFKIVIEAICIDGSLPSLPAEGIHVTSKLNLSGCNFPTTLQPGQMAMCIIPAVTLCTNFTDIVTVTATNAPPDADDTDSVSVVIKPIAVHCVSLFTSSFDMDDLTNNCVTIPDGSADVPVTLTTTLYNDSDVPLDVTVTGLPPLVDCADQVTPIVITQPIQIPARGTHVITGCYIAACANVTFPIEVHGTVSTNVPNADCRCFYNRNGQPISTDLNSNDRCPVCVICTPAVTCRVTGGGVLLPGFVDQSCIEVNTTIFPFTSPNGLTIKKITHGGQLGAPFSQMDCGAILGNPCIRGQWSHIRHYEGTANPRDVIDMDFHSQTPKGQYDSLSCACLGCCDPVTGAFIPAVQGPLIHKFQICNPDDHKVCGPQPRPAPANVIIWSGIGRVTPTDDTGGSRAAQAEWVVFRVYIEDRSEPGGGHPGGAVEPADIYCFQAWKTGIKVSKKPDFSTISAAFRTALGAANCDFLRALESGAIPIGTLPSPEVNGLSADIQDCGPMHDGNHQIHPATGATCTQ